MLSFRRSTYEDIPRLLEIYSVARTTMRESGNLTQWPDTYPSYEILSNDISRENSYVIENNGKIIATFAFIIGEDPTYKVIYNGEWLDDTKPYGTIHRIASDRSQNHILESVISWCFLKIDNVRIDTHKDNIIMRHLLKKQNFKYCGIIYLLNGDERLAFQRLL